MKKGRKEKDFKMWKIFGEVTREVIQMIFLMTSDNEIKSPQN